MSKESKTKNSKSQPKKQTVSFAVKTDLITEFTEAGKLKLELHDSLSKIYVSKKKVNESIKWFEIRKEKKLTKRLRREKVRQLRDERRQELAAEAGIAVENQKHVVIGFNRVVKQLQADKLALVLGNIQ